MINVPIIRKMAMEYCIITKIRRMYGERLLPGISLVDRKTLTGLKEASSSAG